MITHILKVTKSSFYAKTQLNMAKDIASMLNDVVKSIESIKEKAQQRTKKSKPNEENEKADATSSIQTELRYSWW